MPDEENAAEATSAADPAEDGTIMNEATEAEGAGAEADDAGEAEDEKSGDDPLGYESLELPEDMEIDQAALGEFKEVAAKMNGGKGLAKEDAQQLINMRVEISRVQTDQWEEHFAEWRGELMDDKDFGGDKLKTQTIPDALAAVKEYGDDELAEAIKRNHLYGEYPPLVRFMARIGATLRQDKLVRGRSGPAQTEQNDEEIRLRNLFPTDYDKDGKLKVQPTDA